MMRGLFGHILGLWRDRGRKPEAAPPVRRRPVDHVILLDGTMGALSPSGMTSIGVIYEFLRAHQPRGSHYYGAGVQFHEWRDLRDMWFGWGVNAQIQRAYGWLATRYRPGDQIYLIGYSRGAFAARSLAGMIERVGLLRATHATERNVTLAWRHYETGGPAEAFRDRFCHEAAPIRMVGAFDTVRGLGYQIPVAWMLSEPRYRFHDHRLGPSVAYGFHALALNETRALFEPLLWDSAGTGAGRIEQVWFRGTHGDIGGQLGGCEAARPLANVPLVWMLASAQSVGLSLPEGWRAAFPADPGGVSSGSWSGFGKFFLARAPRVIGRDPSERIDTGALEQGLAWWLLIRPRVAEAARSISGALWLLSRSGRRAQNEAGRRAERIDPAIGATDFATSDTR